MAGTKVTPANGNGPVVTGTSGAIRQPAPLGSARKSAEGVAGNFFCVLRRGARPGSIVSSPVCRPLAGLLLVLAAQFLLAALVHYRSPPGTLILALQLFLVGLGGVLVFEVYRRVNQQLLMPLGHLRQWALRMRAGRLDARILEPQGGEFALLARDINGLSDELQRLSEKMDNEVCKQTESLAQKTRSLQVLYDVAASVNIFNDLDDLLTRFLYTLIDVVKARAAAVRLLDGEDNQMRMVASVGLSEQDLEGEERVPLERFVWGRMVSADDWARGEAPRADAVPAPVGGPEGLEAISIPLRYHGKILGAYNLYVERLELVERDDIRDLLTSVGRHLGMAIEKVRVDQQAQRLSIIQERNLLAHELHDSLAQTLASLRFQVRMLDETLQQGEPAEAAKGLEKIRNGLDEANTELRDLLAHFRAPMDKRGLLPALEDVVARFRRETDIVTFFQKECAHPNLPASMEMQVLRIVQEGLANIRKHSQAHAVRILLRCEKNGRYHLMIEDDGIGFSREVIEGRPGEHLGLEILRERARRIGAELLIDSEPAEGTRMELNFVHPGS